MRRDCGGIGAVSGRESRAMSADRRREKNDLRRRRIRAFDERPRPISGSAAGARRRHRPGTPCADTPIRWREAGESAGARDLAKSASGAVMKGVVMLYWALVFFIVALVAALFGFGGIAVASAGIAKILFFLFLIVFLITLVMGLAGRGRTVV